MWEMQALGLDEAVAGLDRAATALDHPETFLEGEGARLVGADVRENFRQGGRPDRWVDVTARTLAGRKKNKNPDPLIDTEALMDAASADRPGVPGSLFRVQGDTLTEGTDLVQAASMQYGRPDDDIPARPFEQLTLEDEARLGQAMDDDWLHRLLAAM